MVASASHSGAREGEEEFYASNESLAPVSSPLLDLSAVSNLSCLVGSPKTLPWIQKCCQKMAMELRLSALFIHRRAQCLWQEVANWRLFRASLVHQERAGLFSDRVPAAQQPRGRVVLPRRWAHELGAPERGCLLVARRPDMGPLLTQSVILLLEHGAPG